MWSKTDPHKISAANAPTQHSRRRPDGVAILQDRKVPTQATVAPCDFNRTERNTVERLKPALERMKEAYRNMPLDWRSKLTLHNN